jgi:hypothetical protein
VKNIISGKRETIVESKKNGLNYIDKKQGGRESTRS